MTIMVTGGAGFIGSNFVLDWFETGDEPVVNLDLLTYAGNLRNLDRIADHPGHRFFHGDICNRTLVDALLKEFRPRAIVHLAAESHVDQSIRGPASFIQTNVLGTYSLARSGASTLGWPRRRGAPGIPFPSCEYG